MEEKMLNELIGEASALIEQDRKVVKALLENDLDSFRESLMAFRKMRNRVRELLSWQPTVEGVSEEVKNSLLRAQQRFTTDEIIKEILGTDLEDDPFEGITMEEENRLSDLFYSWIGPYDYVRNIFKVKTIVLLSSVSPSIRRYIDEARNCFALEQHNAVISLCRTILEAAAKDLCEKMGFFKPYGEKIIGNTLAL